MEEKQLTGYPSIDKPWLKYYSEEAIHAPLPEGTAYAYLSECARDKRNHTALNYFGRKTSYAQLFSQIDRAAASFLELGIAEGDVVPVAMASTPEMVIAFYALNKIGAVSNWVDLRTIDGSLAEAAKLDTKALVMHDFCLQLIQDKTVLDRFPHIILVSPADSLPAVKKSVFRMTHPKVRLVGQQYLRWHSFMTLACAETDACGGLGADRIAAIVHTGGTTGLSKGVVLTNGNINAVAFQLKEGSPLKAQPGESFMNLAPPFVAYGLCNSVHYPLCTGMELLLVPEHTPGSFPKLIYTLKPNHVFCVPVLWNALAEDHSARQRRYPYLKTIVTGADKMDVALEKKINGFLSTHGCQYEIAQGYGLTETGAGVCCSPQRNTLEPGSVGVPFSHTCIAVFEPGTHRELSYDMQGEICISGPTVMLEYDQNPEETAALLQRHEDGRIWAHMGDLGRMMSNGYLFVDGRIKRMIVRHNGFKVFPPNIEKVVLAHPAVTQCAVVGMRDPENLQGFMPVAHVVPANRNCDTETLRSELQLLCDEKLPQLERPYLFLFRDSLPFTALGKVDYRALECLGEATGG